ncbi:sporulation histidine kinase inhibitor Sda [Rummeliibacillus sp. TYF005]|uniref:sporulation histidine kinase inhibitor Sda n=1 Tax=unclassified Rummeliibacillus TaxID=2622809 RepID=UPI000E66F066|nr:sporulation histidine kinase inhibitor Sda [Rummeliibacillus sp. POC4]RPJ96498.1 sporulation histidine kinase inhibitor Sda [Rummeliibacillus sp. TYF005]
MDTLSDELLIEAYNEAKTFQLNSDFIRLLEDEILRRIAVRMIIDCKAENIDVTKTSPIDSNAFNRYFNLA